MRNVLSGSVGSVHEDAVLRRGCEQGDGDHAGVGGEQFPGQPGARTV